MDLAWRRNAPEMQRAPGLAGARLSGAERSAMGSVALTMPELGTTSTTCSASASWVATFQKGSLLAWIVTVGSGAERSQRYEWPSWSNSAVRASLAATLSRLRVMRVGFWSSGERWRPG